MAVIGTVYAIVVLSQGDGTDLTARVDIPDGTATASQLSRVFHELQLHFASEALLDEGLDEELDP